MMESHQGPHADTEALSAFIDGELGAEERLATTEHLRVCDACRAELESLRRANAMLASLPPKSLSSEASRELRKAVLEKAPGRRRRQRWGAVAGAIGLAAAVLIGVVVLPDLLGRPGTVDEEAAELAAFPSSFADASELEAAVRDDPEVTRALDAYTVSDVAGTQESEVGRLSAPSEAEQADAPSGSASLEADSSPTTQEGCLRLVLSKVDYPMIPVLSRSITYQGVDSFLYVFAWTDDDRPDAPLDRIQIWVMTASECTQQLYLSYRSG